MLTEFRFFVNGLPAPGGSKKAFKNPKTGGVILVDAGGKKNKEWKQNVRDRAAELWVDDYPPFDGPLMLLVTFIMPRPQGHFHTGKKAGQLKADAPVYHTITPDATKLVRSTEDALKHICWNDDSQVADQRARKVYRGFPGLPDRIGAEIIIRKIDPIRGLIPVWDTLSGREEPLASVIMPGYGGR